MEAAAGRSYATPIIIEDDLSDENNIITIESDTDSAEPPTKRQRLDLETSRNHRIGQQLRPLILEAIRSLPVENHGSRDFHADFMRLLVSSHGDLTAGSETEDWSLSSEQKRKIRQVLNRECEAIAARVKRTKQETLEATRRSSHAASINALYAPDLRQDAQPETNTRTHSGRNLLVVDEARQNGRIQNVSLLRKGSQTPSSASTHIGTSRDREESTPRNGQSPRVESPVPLPEYAKHANAAGSVSSTGQKPGKHMRPFPQNPERPSSRPLMPLPENPERTELGKLCEAVAETRPQRPQPPHQRQSKSHAQRFVEPESSRSESDPPPLSTLLRMPSSSISPTKWSATELPQSVVPSLSPSEQQLGEPNGDITDAQVLLAASSLAPQHEGLDSSRSENANPQPVVVRHRRHRRQVARLDSSSDESSRNATPRIATNDTLPTHVPARSIPVPSGGHRFKRPIHSRYKPAKPIAMTKQATGNGIRVSSVHNMPDVRSLDVPRKLPKGLQLPSGVRPSFQLPRPKDRKGTWESPEERDELEAAIRSFFGQKGMHGIEKYVEKSTKRKHIPKLVQGTRRLVALAQDVHGGQRKRERDINNLLCRREIEGSTEHGKDNEAALHRFDPSNRFRKACEDNLTVVAEYYGCAGDLWAGCWTSNTTLVCGTTTDVDPSSQQYNRRGNLLLCSIHPPGAPTGSLQGQVQAYPDHRVARPVVIEGENSSASMRSALEPWVYPSVTFADYDQQLGFGYTSSYDHTVKLWRFGADHQTMQSVATWQHQGRVNFVIGAKDGSGRVATGTDVPTDAVRVYEVDPENPQGAMYTSFSCSRTDADNETWSYYPSTMRWGISEQTKHLLLVGFSPRNVDNTEKVDQCPREKSRTGELILWDSIRRQRIAVTGGGTSNIFEIAWHPTLPRFYTATSADVTNEHHNVRTQIHVHEIDETGAYRHLQKLDCPAYDINELAILPNSPGHAYIAASCNNKRTYIWDSAVGDMAIRQLCHGKPIAEYYEKATELEEDVGTKFTAWGNSPDRLYTGGSDGNVNVWDVRKGGEAKVRTIFTAKAGVTIGVFSPDKKSLAIGDASGTLYILSVDGEPHPHSIEEILDFEENPPRPGLDEESLGRLARLEANVDEENANFRDWHRALIDDGVVVQHPDPTLGWFQGPNYHLKNWYCPELHRDGDKNMPILAEWQRVQQSEEAHRKTMLEQCARRKRIVPPRSVHLSANQDLEPDVMSQLSCLELSTMMMDEEGFLSRRVTDEVTSSDELLRNLALEGTVLVVDNGVAECELVEDDMYALE